MKLFYDHLIDRTKFGELIEKESKSQKEKKKLEQTLDEIIHNTVLNVILIHLDEKHHEEFLALLHKTPHSEELLVYLKQKGHPEIEKKIQEEAQKIIKDIISDLHS